MDPQYGMGYGGSFRTLHTKLPVLYVKLTFTACNRIGGSLPWYNEGLLYLHSGLQNFTRKKEERGRERETKKERKKEIPGRDGIIQNTAKDTHDCVEK